MTIWEMEQIAKENGKTIYGEDESKWLKCPICGRGSREYWGQMRCVNKHFLSLNDFVSKYIKRNAPENNNIGNFTKKVFKNAIDKNIDDLELTCYKCNEKVKKDGYYLKCKNGHQFTFEEYLTGYIDMLDGFAKNSCFCSLEKKIIN